MPKIKSNQNNANFATMLAAGSLYGGWAYYINAFAGFHRAILSAFAQGIASFFIAGVLIVAMEYCYHHVNPLSLRLFITSIIPVSLLLLLVGFVHFIIGTPRIIDTLLPSTIIGFLYSFIYTARLYQTQQNAFDTL